AEPQGPFREPGFRLELRVEDLFTGAIVGDAGVVVIRVPLIEGPGRAIARGVAVSPRPCVDGLRGGTISAGVVVALLAVSVAREKIEGLILPCGDGAARAARRLKEIRPVHADTCRGWNLGNSPRGRRPNISTFCIGLRRSRVGAEAALE